mgnify:CR=1 FL=1
MNTTKSEQIKAGLRKSFQTGESAKASTVCYGYKVTSEGKLVAYPTEAIIVFHIFERIAFVLGLFSIPKKYSFSTVMPL